MEGHEKIVYHIYGIPVLYQYALKLKHIGGVTADLLNISGKRTSKEDTMIARYLLRRILAMKNKSNCVNLTVVIPLLWVSFFVLLFKFYYVKIKKIYR